MRRLAFLYLLASSAGIAVLPQDASAGVPAVISFQGRLADPAGAASTAAVDVTFRLYAAETGGGAVWTEMHAGVAPDERGVFSVLLGSATDLGTVDFTQALWLGVTVGADLEMAPRFRLVTVPYAMRAVSAAQADNAAALGSVTESTVTALAQQVNTNTADVTASTGAIGSNATAIAGKADAASLIDGNTATAPVGWADIVNIPGDITDGDDGVVAAGAGILISGDTVSADVGMGTGQVAAGNHIHDGRYYTEAEMDAALAGAAAALLDDGGGEIDSAADFGFAASTFVTNLDVDTVDGFHATDILAGPHDHSKLAASDLDPNPALSVDADGRVRIGTTQVDFVLKPDATPTVEVGGSAAASVITTSGVSGYSAHVGIEIPSNDAGDGFYVATDADSDGTVDTVAMKIDAFGRTGIGTTAPATTLHVAGSATLENELVMSSPSPQIHFLDTTAGNNDYWLHVNDGLLYFLYDDNDDGTWDLPPALRFNGREAWFGGNVGVGTATPAAKLHVSGAGGEVARFAGEGTAGTKVTVSNTTALMDIGIGATNPHPYLWSSSNGLCVGSDGWPTMYVDGMSGGKVGIGTMTPAERLHVDGNLRVDGTIEGSVHVSNITGLLGQGYTVAFPDIYNNRAPLQIAGIVSGGDDRCIILHGPGYDIERIPGWAGTDHDDQPGPSDEHALIFEAPEPYATNIKAWCDEPSPAKKTCSISITNVFGDQVVRWDVFDVLPAGYEAAADGRTKFTLQPSDPPDIQADWLEGVGSSHGTSIARNLATDTRVEIAGIVDFYPVVEALDEANRTVTLTYDYNEGRDIFVWVKATLQGYAGVKRGVAIVEEYTVPPFEFRRNYFGVFPVKYELYHGFGLTTKVKSRVVLSYDFWEDA